MEDVFEDLSLEEVRAVASLALERLSTREIAVLLVSTLDRGSLEALVRYLSSPESLRVPARR